MFVVSLFYYYSFSLEAEELGIKTCDDGGICDRNLEETVLSIIVRLNLDAVSVP